MCCDAFWKEGRDREREEERREQKGKGEGIGKRKKEMLRRRCGGPVRLDMEINNRKITWALIILLIRCKMAEGEKKGNCIQPDYPGPRLCRQPHHCSEAPRVGPRGLLAPFSQGSSASELPAPLAGLSGEPQETERGSNPHQVSSQVRMWGTLKEASTPTQYILSGEPDLILLKFVERMGTGEARPSQE